MLSKKNFFEDFTFNSRKFKQNLKKTKIVFNSFKSDLQYFKIPLLQSYDKNYIYDFTPPIIKKFNKYKNIIIIGMGGSILGSKAIYSFFKDRIKKKVFFFDNLDTNLHLQFNKIKNLKNSCFIIISKSGNTLETIANFSMIFSKSLLKNKLVIITEVKDNILNKIASEFNAEIIEHKDFIGGRYSVLSEVGMFPAALMGLNLNKFKNLKTYLKNKDFVSSLIKNVASIYTLNLKKISNSIILNYDSDLNDLGYWYQQLIAESLGKKGKGIHPSLSFGPKDHHSLLQLYLDGPKDKFFTFFNSLKTEGKFVTKNKFILNNMNFLKNKKIDKIINVQCKATKNIFKLKKIPYREITFKKRDEKELGMIFTFFVLETILLARLMHINPFDQPAVEEVKTETKKFLR